MNTGWENHAQPSALYVNDNNVYTEPFFATGGISGTDTLGALSNVMGDFNNDGLIDIATGGNGNRPFRLFSNHGEQVNQFIKLDLEGTTSNKELLGQ